MGGCVSFFGGAIVIVLQRLGGGLFALNPDLIERVEATPDTVVTLTDDKKFLVDETLEQVLELIVDYRAYVLIRSNELSIVDNSGRPTLHIVPNELVTSTKNSLASGVDLDFGSAKSSSVNEMLDEMDAGLEALNEHEGDQVDGGVFAGSISDLKVSSSPDSSFSDEEAIGSDLDGGGK